jgi:DNA end-binding protein Ku
MSRSTPRPIWTGQISFGLVSIPVGLYPAVDSTEKIRFHYLHKKDRAPIQYKKFCSRENVEVPNDEIVRGRRAGKGRWTVLEAGELEKVAEEAVAETGKDLIEVLAFVPPTSIDPMSFDQPYYVAPRRGGEKAYSVLRAALADSGRAGIVRFALRTRPHLGALLPAPKSLELSSLRPFEELRDPTSLPVRSTPMRPAEIKLAETLIRQMSADGWKPSEHPDAYRHGLEKLLASKHPVGEKAPAGRRTTAKKEEGEVVDLMEALRRSVGSGRSRGRSTVGSRRGARRAGAA